MPALALAVAFVAGGASLASSIDQEAREAALAAEQREALQNFVMMDGEWRGSAWQMTPTGERVGDSDWPAGGAFHAEAMRRRATTSSGR